jgi:thiol:disulfide interchange protein
MKYLEPYLPPVRQAADAAIDPDEPWILNDYRGALLTASQSRKLVFVDFTGYTCTNCRWMETNIFDRPDVRAELSEFVLSRLYTDGEGKMFEDQQALQEKNFGTVALPLYAIVDWNGRTVAVRSGISRDPAEFIQFLKSAKPRLIAEDRPLPAANY